MTTYLYRCMIVPAEIVQTCRALTAGLAGDAGANMFIVPLSASGELPATHYISAGQQGDDFCALLPLTGFDTDGVATTVPGQPDTIVYLAGQAGITVTLEQIESLLSAVEVSEQDWQTALSRRGLQTIRQTLA